MRTRDRSAGTSQQRRLDLKASRPRAHHVVIVSLVCHLASACASAPIEHTHDLDAADFDPAIHEPFDAWWLGYRLLQRAIERESGDLAVAGAELLIPYNVAVPLAVETRGALPPETTLGNAFHADPLAPLRALVATHADPALTRRLAAHDAAPAVTSELRTPPHHAGRLAPEGRVYVALSESAEDDALEVAIVGELHSRWSLWLYDPKANLACNDAFARCRVSTSGGVQPGLWDVVLVNESDRPMSYVLFVR